MLPHEELMVRLVEFGREHFPTLASWLRSERDLVQWGGPELTYPLTDHQLEQMVEEGKMTPPARLCWMAVDVAQTLVGRMSSLLSTGRMASRVSLGSSLRPRSEAGGTRPLY